MLNSEEQVPTTIEKTLTDVEVVAEVKKLLPIAHEALLKNRRGLKITQFAMDPQVEVSTYRDNDGRFVGETTLVEDREGHKEMKRIIFQDGEGRIELGYGTVKIQDPESKATVKGERGVISYVSRGNEKNSLNTAKTLQNVQKRVNVASVMRSK